jgi:hypothetical protein
MGVDPARSLPVRVEPADDEGGLGFIFRLLSANGLSFRDAQHWLGLKSWNPLKAQEIKVLAWIAGVDQSWLVDRTVTCLGWDAPRTYGLMGHRFGTGMADYLHSAKLCPLCVKRKKYHRVTWQLRCICCCIEHAALLSERCPHCGNLIRWNRPAVDICSCGRFITAASAMANLPPHVSGWVEWLECRLLNSESYKSAASYGLPTFLGSLSIDGAFRVVVAVGLLPDVNCPLSQASAWATTSIGMAEIVSRGIERLLCLGNRLSDISSIEPLIHLPILERMRTNGASSADINCASVLLNYLRAGSKTHFEQRGRYLRGQLPLFN